MRLEESSEAREEGVLRAAKELGLHALEYGWQRFWKLGICYTADRTQTRPSDSEHELFCTPGQLLFRSRHFKEVWRIGKQLL